MAQGEIHQDISLQEDPAHAWDSYDRSIERYEQDLAVARELGDAKWEAALLQVPELASEVAVGRLSVYEVNDRVTTTCAPTEFTRTDVDASLGSAMESVQDLDRAFATTRLSAPMLNADSGYFEWSVLDGAETPISTDNEPSMADIREQADPDEVAGPGCEAMIVSTLQTWAEGKSDREFLLEGFTAEGVDIMSDLMDLVVEMGWTPEEAPMALGNALLPRICIDVD